MLSTPSDVLRAGVNDRSARFGEIDGSAKAIDGYD